MDPNNTGFPMQQQNPGYPVPAQGNQQQFPYYPNQMPSFPHSTAPSQPSFNSIPLQQGGAMMPPAFPQQSTGPHANFSTPFTQPPMTGAFAQPTTTTANIPATQAQSFPQNMASGAVKSMAPTQQQTPPQQGPSQSTAQAQSPVAAARDKERVSVLLEINSMLLEEVVNLQSTGKAGGPPAQQAPQDSNPSNPSPTSETADKNAQKTPEYVNCMRRLQVNLAYLATVADKGKKAGGVVPPAPAIMTPPPHMPTINGLYAKLNELFPRTVNANQTGAQGSQGNGGPSPSPITENVV
ncbi:hypothetical protein BJY04DRAFT_195049 [Aspergillus karnatakaensis]|uniref:uncharacterized protein n=1 Tax=Aspergillus karnatakaensis TaxID=1810916 RepID=UPI003CCD3CF3